MNKITKINILKKLLKNFEEEDKKEPFLDRGYVEETKKIYQALMEGAFSDDFQERAIYDIGLDIFKYLAVDGFGESK